MKNIEIIKGLRSRCDYIYHNRKLFNEQEVVVNSKINEKLKSFEKQNEGIYLNNLSTPVQREEYFKVRYSDNLNNTLIFLDEFEKDLFRFVNIQMNVNESSIF